LTIEEELFAEDAALYAFHFSSLSLDSLFCCNGSIAKIGISDDVMMRFVQQTQLTNVSDIEPKPVS